MVPPWMTECYRTKHKEAVTEPSLEMSEYSLYYLIGIIISPTGWVTNQNQRSRTEWFVVTAAHVKSAQGTLQAAVLFCPKTLHVISR